MITIDEAIEILEQSSGEGTDTSTEFDEACYLAVKAIELLCFFLG